MIIGAYVMDRLQLLAEIEDALRTMPAQETLLHPTEDTFGWLGRYHRLARDYEHTVESSEAMVYLASIRRMLKVATK